MNRTRTNNFEDAAEESNQDLKVAPAAASDALANRVQPTAFAAKWQAIANNFAEQAGIAVLLVDGQQPPALAASNNNSICRVLQSSRAHAHLCEPFCGKAFENLQKAGKEISYVCHAGLQCVVAPLAPNAVRPLAAIVGRAFVKISDYQNLLDRVNNGDWGDLPLPEIERNLLFAENEAEVAAIADAFERLCEDESNTLIEFVARTEPNPFSAIAGNVQIPATDQTSEVATIENQEFDRPTLDRSRAVETAATAPDAPNQTIEDFTAWQLFTDSLLDKNFKAACGETLRFLAARYDLKSLAWLERASNNQLKPFLAADNLREKLPRLELFADDPNLHAAVLDETSHRPRNSGEIEIFPLAVGEDVRAAIVVVELIADDIRRRRIARFCHQIAVSLEVLRLREELARRAEIVRAVQLFNERLNQTDPENLFDSLMETCAEFLQAARGSLLIFDQSSEQLRVVAAIGERADELKTKPIALGERVAEQVFQTGKPVVMENAAHLNLPPAPPERGYRSVSFISFPLITGNRTIGVLNVTDKRGDAGYTQVDLDLLEAIAPQLAIALDRATYQQRAGMFEQLSITDSLTGLLNRRYLNERLSEEVNRSNRDGSPMSFLMIDIDNFKSYNDLFLHQAGDEVLRMTAQCLKAVLRSADVAARFGGEEFCLLLPQTTLSEARLIAERIRERIEQTDFPNRKITVSVGVASYSPFQNSPREIIEAADKALYQAKRIGKNNVQIWLYGQTRS